MAYASLLSVGPIPCASQATDVPANYAKKQTEGYLYVIDSF